MDIERILGELKGVKRNDVYYADSKVKKLYGELIRESLKAFPDNKDKINELNKKTRGRNHGPFGSDILNTCKIIERYFAVKHQRDLRESKSFLGPKDLIEQARMVLRNGQDSYAISLCDAAVEAFLKDVFDVPSTIRGAGTVKFLSECMILKIPEGMGLYMKEVKNKVSQMDNQVKHKAYLPSRLDAINALKAVEELYVRRSRFKNLSSEEKRRVHVGIGILKNDK